MAGPKVSVIIPTYNRKEMIGGAIENMERQTLRPHEIIVVDDGSTDGSVEYLRGFGDRIRLIVQENLGPGAARNAGLAVATGDFIQFFDSDDLCTLNKIEGQARALEASGADIAYGPWVQVWLDDGFATLEPMIVQQAPTAPDALSAFLRGWVCLIPCCLIRRDLLIRLGGYPTAARTTEDLELFFRALLSSPKLEYAPNGVVLVRQHPEGQISASALGAVSRLQDRARLMRVVNDVLKERGEHARPIDRASWGLTAWEAFRDERRAVHGTGGESRLGMTALHLLLRVRQIRAGLRKRLSGSRFSGLFAPRKIRPDQEAGIRDLGFEIVWK